MWVDPSAHVSSWGVVLSHNGRFGIEGLKVGDVVRSDQIKFSRSLDTGPKRIILHVLGIRH